MKTLPTGIVSRLHTVRGKEVKQYRVRVSDPSRRDARGRTVQVSSRWFNSLAEARSFQDDARRRLLETGTLNVDRRITVSECVTNWIERSETVGMEGRAPISETTAERYRSVARNLIDETIGSMRMAELRASQMRTWIDDLALERGNDAAHRALGLMKMVFKHAVVSEVVPVSPVESVSIAKRSTSAESDDGSDTAPDTFMAPSEVAALRQAFDRLADTDVRRNDEVRGMGDYQRDQRRLAFGRWRLLFYTLLLTGMRLGEASALQWKHVESDLSLLRIEQGRKRSGKVGRPKTRNSVRTVTIGAQLVDLMAKYRGDAGDDAFVFGTATRPLNPRRFYEAWALALDLAMLEGWTPHDLRHFHASTLINKGVLPQQVCDRLGHANVTITLGIYAHLFRALSGAGNTAGAEMEGELLG